jgi:uncharacterized membrane protein SpoIIM required for sporulation
VKLDDFLGQREGAWNDLEERLRKARGKPERLGPDGVRELGLAYRATAADLAVARRAVRGDPVVARLEALVARAHATIYGSPRGGGLRAFYSHEYWRLIRERPRALALAAVLLFGSALLAYAWARSDPRAALGALPKPFQAAANPPTGSRGLDPAQHAAFSSEIFTNNIRVTFLAFAGGIFAGLGTVLVLLFNGVLLGAVAGLAIGAGNGEAFVQLVTAHGVLELSCIVVTAAAGLRLGAALVDPGPRRRSVALAKEARLAVAMVLGTMPWLVLAGLVEGFVTPSGYGTSLVVVVGVALGAAFWLLVAVRGGAGQSRTRALALR